MRDITELRTFGHVAGRPIHVVTRRTKNETRDATRHRDRVRQAIETALAGEAGSTVSQDYRRGVSPAHVPVQSAAYPRGDWRRLALASDQYAQIRADFESLPRPAVIGRAGKWRANQDALASAALLWKAAATVERDLYRRGENNADVRATRARKARATERAASLDLEEQAHALWLDEIKEAQGITASDVSWHDVPRIPAHTLD